jgi:hypothetical protein
VSGVDSGTSTTEVIIVNIPANTSYTLTVDNNFNGGAFTGWSGSSSSTSTTINGSVNSNLSFTANYEDAPIVTATFDSNGGTPTYNSVTGQAPLSVSSPGSPTRSGFTFTGWSPSLPTTITSDRTFVAQWQAVEPPPPFFPPSFVTKYTLIASSSPSGADIQYTVTGVDSGTSNTEIIVTNIPNGTGYSLSAPSTFSGKIFSAWSGSSTSSSTSITGSVTSNVTFVANYVDPPTVTATFDGDGGTTFDPVSGFSPLSVSSPGTPTKSGYNFTG